MPELYMLTFANGKRYIGMTHGTAKSRFGDHRCTSRKLKFPVYSAWRKYGEPNMKVLAIVDASEIHASEIRAIRVYGTQIPHGYNLTAGGEGVTGYKHSAENIEKARQRGLRYKPTSEAIARIRAALIDKPRPDHVRAKISAAQKGIVNMGRTMTSEQIAHRERVKQAKKDAGVWVDTRKGVPQIHVISDAARERIRAARRGYKPSAETIEKSAATRKANDALLNRVNPRKGKPGPKQSPETIEKRMVSRKANKMKLTMPSLTCTMQPNQTGAL